MSESDPVATSLVYRVYSNGGTGGPVDYSVPIATTSDLTIDLGPLGAPGRHSFGVRVLDPSTGLEEMNTDVSTTIILDDTGSDVTGRPEAPRLVTVSATSGGGCRVSWAYPPTGPWGVPESFRVDLGTGNGASSQTASVPYTFGKMGYVVVVPGPLARGEYWVEVRAVNGRGIGPASERVLAWLGLSIEPLSMDPVTVRVT